MRKNDNPRNNPNPNHLSVRRAEDGTTIIVSMETAEDLGKFTVY